MKHPHTKQHGFTLIEILIGLLVGIIGVAAAVALVTGIVGSNADNLKKMRLNQELRGVMDLMTRDLKRAGYSAAATGTTSANPFMISSNILYISTSCVTFAYDRDADGGAVTTNDQFGYRLSGGAVQSRTGGNVCSATSGWDNITDENVVNVTALNFQNKSIGTQIRYIGITLTGQLLSDPSISRTLTEMVRVRNDTP